VRIYIKDFTDGDNIYAGLPPPPIPIANLRVQVRIVSPHAWLGTPDGIVGYVISVRVDPTVLEVVGIEIPDDKDPVDGFSDGILEMYAALLGAPASTLQAAEAVDPTTGTMVGFANSLVGVNYTTVGGAGGDPFYGDDEAGLATITFKTKSATDASVIDLMSPGEIVDAIDIGVRYINARGEEIGVEPEDGYYVAETPDRAFFGLTKSASAIGSEWHELWPVYSQNWQITSHEDTDGDGELDVSENFNMTNLETGEVKWFHVDWLNPDPVPGDGKADLIVTEIPLPIPEFPLGLGIIMTIAPAIPIIYLWRKRKWVGKK
jgi:hypothetical protein